MDKNIAAAIRWLSESDIRNKEKDTLSFGGISNGYFYDDKKYQYVYNEITGYAINSFLTIYSWTGAEKYLQYAKNAADYLMQQQKESSDTYEHKAIPHSLTLPDFKRVDKYYTFDNAIILHGLANLSEVTGESKYLNCCNELCTWLLKMQKEDGAFYSHYDATENNLRHAYDEFFYDDGCLHVKNAIGLIYYGQLSNENRFVEAGKKVCDWAAKLLSKDGLFWANRRKKYVFTHAHCYAAEGYLYAYYFCRNQDYLNVVRQAGDALINCQNMDGSLYRIYKKKLSMKRWIGSKHEMSLKWWIAERKHPWKTVDATSQAIRIWLLLYSIDKNEKYMLAAKKALTFIKSCQVLVTDDSNMLGGFYYQCLDNGENNDRILNKGMYTWCTQFGTSAYMLYESVKAEKSFDELIFFLF